MTKIIKKYVSAKHYFYGIHFWPNAGKDRSYLRYKHRHKFKAQIMVEVFENDREIEFHDLGDWLRNVLPDGDYGSNSCEDIGTDLLDSAVFQFPGRDIIIRIDEDDDFGAAITLTLPTKKDATDPDGVLNFLWAND